MTLYGRLEQKRNKIVVIAVLLNFLVCNAKVSLIPGMQRESSLLICIFTAQAMISLNGPLR